MKRAAALCLALWLALTAVPAAAGAQPPPEGLSRAWEAGEPLSLVLSLKLRELAGFSKTSLEVIGEWLSQARLALTLRREGASALRLLMGDRVLLALEGEARDALPLPFEEAEADALIRRLPALGSALLDGLSPYGQPGRAGVRVRGAGKTARSVLYTLSAEAWNGLWQESLAAAGLPEAPGSLFRELRFEREGTLTRYLNEDGTTAGLRFAGVLSRLGEDGRRVSLDWGRRPGAEFYLNLELPALRGRNRLSLTLSGVRGEDGLKAEGRFSRRQGGDSASGTLKLKLESREGEEGPRLAGRVQAALTQNGVRWGLDLSPELGTRGEAREGSVAFELKRGRDERWSGQLSLALAPRTEAPEGEALPLEGRQAAAALEAALAGLLSRLNPRERLHLLRDLGGGWGPEAPRVPLPDGLFIPDPAAEDGSYVVEEGLP